MLDQLKQIAIFAKTVDHGSFRAAARALDLSPSVVSHHIAQLEERLGTALLYRSTRKLSVTEDGKRLLADAYAMINAAEAGLQSVADHGRQPTGVLRVTVPAVLAHSKLMGRIAAFSTGYPRVQLDLDFSDTRREVIGDGIDVAIRMGWLQDSALKARKLYEVRRVLIASEAYVSGRPVPKSPKDLEDWDWLELSPVRLRPEFRKSGRRSIRLKPTPRLNANDAYALYRLARAGAGLAILPESLSREDIGAGTMVNILPDWDLESIGVFAVWPPNAPKAGLTSMFVEALASRADDAARSSG